MARLAVKPKTSAVKVLARLKSLADPRVKAGMARFAVPDDCALGISTPQLRRLAREIGRDHSLAGKLWDSGIHEARILAAFVDVPALTSEAQMERWAKEFDSWDVCDCCCGNLFGKTPVAYRKAL